MIENPNLYCNRDRRLPHYLHLHNPVYHERNTHKKNTREINLSMNACFMTICLNEILTVMLPFVPI